MQRYNIFLKAPKYLNNCYAETNSSPFHWSLRPFSLRYFTPVARGRVFLPRTFFMVCFQCGPSPNHRVRLMDAVMVAPRQVRSMPPIRLGSSRMLLKTQADVYAPSAASSKPYRIFSYIAFRYSSNILLFSRQAERSKKTKAEVYAPLRGI
jgi:hypothetical protein